MKVYDYTALANEVVRQNINLFGTEDEWKKGAQSLSSLGEDGREIFHSIASMSEKYNYSDSEYKFNYHLQNCTNVNIATFIWQCRNVGIDTNQFYIEDGEQPTKLVAPVARRTEAMPTEIETLPYEYVSRSLDRNATSGLQRWLCSLFPKEDVQEVCQRYMVGVTTDGSVIYWLIDEQGRVRSGKFVRYGEDGHRVKDTSRIDVDWVHSRMKHQNLLPYEWRMTQCLFGAHLFLPSYHNEGKLVGLVESEKSAIICSLVFPDVLWVSCGGMTNLQAGNKHLLLKGRKVVLFPDTDLTGETYGLWRDKAAKWRHLGIDVTVSDVLEKHATANQKASKIDIADWLVADLQAKNNPSIEQESPVMSGSGEGAIRTIGDWLDYANETKIDPRRVFIKWIDGRVSIEVRSRKWLEEQIALQECAEKEMIF